VQQPDAFQSAQARKSGGRLVRSLYRSHSPPRSCSAPQAKLPCFKDKLYQHPSGVSRDHGFRCDCNPSRAICGCSWQGVKEEGWKETQEWSCEMVTVAQRGKGRTCTTCRRGAPPCTTCRCGAPRSTISAVDDNNTITVVGVCYDVVVLQRSVRVFSLCLCFFVFFMFYVSCFMFYVLFCLFFWVGGWGGSVGG
jgi:hypothetical protein